MKSKIENRKSKIAGRFESARSMVQLLLVLAMLALAAPFVARAINKPYNAYSAVGVALGGSALTNYAIIGVNTVNGGAPVVTYLDAQAVGTAAVVQFYDCTNLTTATAATTNVRTNQVASTNGFPATTVVVVRHKATDTYERLICAAPVTNNQIAFVSDPVTALAIGDVIYAQYATGKIPINSTNAGTTLSVAKVAGRAVYVGKPDLPLLADVVTAVGTNGVINSMTAIIEPPVTRMAIVPTP